MKRRYKSVLTPTAQTATLCQPGKLSILPESIQLPALEDKRTELGGYYFVAIIQLRAGCRISEVLQIRYSDIILPDRVLVRGLKGSRNKLVSVPECTQIFAKCVEHKFNPFANYNRFTAYRNYKRAGIMLYNDTGKKAKVTHAFRHKLVEDLRQLTENEVIIQDTIGHNSIKSQIHYGKKYKK